MRILHVVHGYPPSMGGSQWLVKNLSEQLVSRHRDEVSVFTTVAYRMEHFWRSGAPAMPAGEQEINGVTVRRFPVFNRLNALRWFSAGVAYRLRLPYNDWLRTMYTGPLICGMAQAIAVAVVTGVDYRNLATRARPDGLGGGVPLGRAVHDEADKRFEALTAGPVDFGHAVARYLVEHAAAAQEFRHRRTQRGPHYPRQSHQVNGGLHLLRNADGAEAVDRFRYEPPQQPGPEPHAQVVEGDGPALAQRYDLGRDEDSIVGPPDRPGIFIHDAQDVVAVTDDVRFNRYLLDFGHVRRNAVAVRDTKLISQTLTYHKPKLRSASAELDPAQGL